MVKASLKGAVDLHVHSAPDIRARRFTDFELMEAGIAAKAKAIVIKSHHGTTMNRAFLANEYNKVVHKGDNDFVMYGSVTLNLGIGGLNPLAVENGAKMGAKIIWLPTMHSSNNVKKNGKSGGIECLENGKPVAVLKKIFETIKEYDLVLGTGHLAPEEIFSVVDMARNMGLKKIVVTHPEFWVVGMSHEDQIKIVKDYDVYLERCYAQPLGNGEYKLNLPDNLDIIRKVGYKNVIVNTDGGQVENPAWQDAFSEYMQYLLDNGVPEEQVDFMAKVTPSKLLGI